MLMRNFKFFATLSFGLFLLGCDRLALDEKTKISLQIPQSVNGKVSASAATLTLEHLVIQVTAPDIAEPILIIKDGHEGGPIPTEFPLDIPSGTGRLIQVLAGYGSGDNNNDRGAYIYYGDVSKALTGATETVPVVMNAIVNNLSEGSQVRGRFLDSLNGGPTGEIKMVYRPAGKPAMVVDKELMIGGWFELMVFNDIPMDYILPDGSYLGEQWMTSSIATSPYVIRQHIPPNDYRRWDMNGMTFQARGNENKFLGFFSRNSSFLADKKVCLDTATPLNNGSLYLNNNFFEKNLLKPVQMKFFLHGTTPAPAATYSSIIGGVAMSTCAALPANEEYLKHLKVSINVSNSVVYDDIMNGSMFGLWAGSLWASWVPGEGVYKSASQLIGDLTSAYVQAKLLPGASDGVDGIKIYSRPWSQSGGTMENYNKECRDDRLAKEYHYTYLKTLPRSLIVGDTLRIRKSDLGAVPAESNIVACLAKGDKLLGNTIDLYLPDTSTIPSEIGVVTANYGNYSSPIANKCQPLVVEMTAASNNGIFYSPWESAQATITSTDYASAPLSYLYAKADCSDTAGSSLTVTFPPNSTRTIAYVKAPAGDVRVGVTSNDRSLSMKSAYQMYFNSEPTSASEIRMGLDTSVYSYSGAEMNVYANGCFPMRVDAVNGSSLARVSGSVTISFKRRDGSTYQLPTGMRLVQSCSIKTAISSTLTFNSEGTKRFAIETGAILPVNMVMKAEGFTYSAETVINNGPVVDHLSIHSATGTPATLTQNSCYPIEVKARDVNNNVVNVPASERVQFYLNARISTYYDSSFFPDDTCSTSNTNFQIDGNTSSKIVYYKPRLAGNGFISYSSWNTMISQGSNDLVNILNMSIAGIPLAAPQGPQYVSINSNNTYQIIGGKAPFTATVVSGSATVNVNTYDPSFSVTASSTVGPVSIMITDSLGASVFLNITVQN